MVWAVGITRENALDRASSAGIIKAKRRRRGEQTMAQGHDSANDHQPHHDDHQRHGHGHSHTHGMIDPTILSTQRGIWAIKWSFVGLLATAMFQVVVVFFILFSAIVAGYEAVDRLLHPRPVEYLWAVVAASIIGFLGNEGVAVFRIRVWKEIGSAALVADGYHARVDGWTSLAVLVGAVGVWLGYPLADPLVGLAITLAILAIVWQSGKAVFTRMLDGVEPEVIEALTHAAMHIPGVQAVTDVRARWIGHHLHAELNVAVPPALSVAEGHHLAKTVHHQLLHHVPFLSRTTIHIDPAGEVGEGGGGGGGEGGGGRGGGGGAGGGGGGGGRNPRREQDGPFEFHVGSQ